MRSLFTLFALLVLAASAQAQCAGNSCPLVRHKSAPAASRISPAVLKELDKTDRSKGGIIKKVPDDGTFMFRDSGKLPSTDPKYGRWWTAAEYADWLQATAPKIDAPPVAQTVEPPLVRVASTPAKVQRRIRHR